MMIGDLITPRVRCFVRRPLQSIFDLRERILEEGLRKRRPSMNYFRLTKIKIPITEYRILKTIPISGTPMPISSTCELPPLPVRKTTFEYSSPIVGVKLMFTKSGDSDSAE